MLAYSLRKDSQEIYFEKSIYLLLLIVAFCLPVFPKAVTFILQAAVLLAMADSALAGRFKMKTPASFVLLLAFVVWAGLSVLKSPDFAESFYNYKVLLPQYLVIYWLTISYVKTVKQSAGILAALLFSAFWVSTYGVYQYFYGGTMLTSGWVDSAYFPTIKTRAFSTLYNPNILASFLVTSLALCLGGIFSRIKVSVQMLLIFLTIISAVCLVFTFSRTAWMSFLVVLLCVCVLYSYKLLYALLPMSLLTFFLARDMIVQRFVSVFEGGDTSSLLRFALWESTMAMIRDNPLTGIGWGAYKFVYPYYDFFINNPDVTIYHAHNMYLNIAAETGLPGLVLFVLLLFMHLFFALKVLKKAVCEEQKALGLGISCVFIGILIGGITDHTLFNMELSSIFWLISALSFVLWQNSKKQDFNCK